MRQGDHDLLEPGMRVRIMPRLMGAELYGAIDPGDYEKWLGQEVTVRSVKDNPQWMVEIEEGPNAEFFMEEIECIVDDDSEISESTELLSVLLGGAI